MKALKTVHLVVIHFQFVFFAWIGSMKNIVASKAIRTFVKELNTTNECFEILRNTGTSNIMEIESRPADRWQSNHVTFFLTY